MLALTRDEGLFVIDTDASDGTVGVFLSLVQDGEEWVIAYCSRLYAHTEINYCTSWRELLARRRGPVTVPTICIGPALYDLDGPGCIEMVLAGPQFSGPTGQMA